MVRNRVDMITDRDAEQGSSDIPYIGYEHGIGNIELVIILIWKY